MPLRPPAGFISAFFDPLNNPNAPTIGTATGDDQSASITFTPPTNVGGSAISSYSALSTPGGFVGTAASSPVTVSGLTNGTAYTFAVWATNTYGPSAYSASSNSATPSLQRGLFGGGAAPSNVIQYISIATTGNAIDFGDLTVARSSLAACASSTRGVFGGGLIADNSRVNVIDYVAIATTGNATDFGDLTLARDRFTGLSNSTRGVFIGGLTASGTVNTMDYITIASTGNATDFGDIITVTHGLTGFASPTRGVYGAGTTPPATSAIGYITIASTGDSTSFGNLTVARKETPAGCSNDTRGVFAGGENAAGNASVNVIDYVTIATTGNATDFGDLATVMQSLAGCSNSTRAVFGGGQVPPASSSMTYITIATTGNSTSFGNLTAINNALAACSNTSGGNQ